MIVEKPHMALSIWPETKNFAEGNSMITVESPYVVELFNDICWEITFEIELTYPGQSGYMCLYFS